VALLQQPVSVPTLAIVGDSDIVDTAVFEGADAFFTGGYEVEIVPDAGHFVPQEAPDAAREAILSFLEEQQ
jgi:pimeloyl-ACP methyl ester carboxylesterase